MNTQMEIPTMQAPKPVPRPADGPRCKTCGRTLHHYDRDRGECFQHSVARTQAEREGKVQLTEDHTRERNRRNYHTNKVIDGG